MMNRSRRSVAIRLSVSIAAAVVLTGCATKGDIRDMQMELRALAQRQDSLLVQLRMQALSTQDTLRTQSDQLFDFRGQVFQQLRAIAQGLTTLEAMVGENQRGIAGVRDQMANLRRTPTTTRPPTGEEGTEAVGGGVGGSAEDLYANAMEQFNRGSTSTARLAFEQFLQAYPTHSLAPDAHFYLADILVQEDRLEEAIDAFREVQELFPTAARVPDALYRIALVHIEMGNAADAEETLERIVNTYPGTGLALLAQDKLDEIR
jgi:tol-pal system protein YbgF